MHSLKTLTNCVNKDKVRVSLLTVLPELAGYLGSWIDFDVQIFDVCWFSCLELSGYHNC